VTLKERFEDAQKRVNGLPRKPANDSLLLLYALYKQATVGEVSGGRPGMMDVKGRAKYDAWQGKRGMSADAAMEAYVTLVDKLCREG
jgi:acyl-CoA-binding protein